MAVRGFGDISERYEAPEDLQIEYNAWLINKAGLEENHFIKLGHALIDKEFYYFIENDINRYNDGIYVRRDFACETLYDDYSSLNQPCNCLEMIYGLAKRINDIIYNPDFPIDNTKECVFCMLQNLGLLIFDDKYFEVYGGKQKVFDILEVFLDRSYDFYGNGGLFPNNKSKKDQRNMEIWYQMADYVNDKYM